MLSKGAIEALTMFPILETLDPSGIKNMNNLFLAKSAYFWQCA
jgi:hypothetical protein